MTMIEQKNHDNIIMEEKKQELDEHRRKSQIRKNAFQRQMEAYVEQLTK